MRMSLLTVQNYRALRDCTVPLSRFGCFIGKNNAGKSTVLQAVLAFLKGTKLAEKDYFDPAKPVRIEILFEDINDSDLNRIAEPHRRRIESNVENGALTLVRRFEVDGKSKLYYRRRVPKEERFSARRVEELLKAPKGKALVDAVERAFPELVSKKFKAATAKKDLSAAIDDIRKSVPDADREFADVPLDTGIDESIEQLLPEAVYIPAVKNLADEGKVTQATPFGKIISMLLDDLQPALGGMHAEFAKLSKLLNRQVLDDQSTLDERHEAVRTVERTVQEYLQETFADVSFEMRFPPPDLRAVIASSELLVDDGLQTPIDAKGDGLRRAAFFAIMRASLSLKKSERAESDSHSHYAMLFEEPELYLHPMAQGILLDALKAFARTNHVLITTHSPAFLHADATESFIKLRKTSDSTKALKPFTEASCVDLRSVSQKNLFQLICYENNNAAFFFESVVLVEGDSDYIVIPHIARLLSPEWNAAASTCKFVRIGGKGSIRRYRQFFTQFGVRTFVVTDLDVLTGGFENLEPTEEMTKCRGELLALVDYIAEKEGLIQEPSHGALKEMRAKTELQGKWRRVKEAWQALEEDKADFTRFEASVNEFFSWEKKDARLEVLRNSHDQDVRKAKYKLLGLLLQNGVFVLEQGALEAYYPKSVTADDKPSRAQEFCKAVTKREAVLELCGDYHDGDGMRSGKKELEKLCECLFGG